MSDYLRKKDGYEDERRKRSEKSKERRKEMKKEYDRKRRPDFIDYAVTAETMKREHDIAAKVLSYSERY